MKIECHLIQNFPPNCLNRDDTNTPKDCEFGGVRRARISSQCFKRAVRDAFKEHQAFPPELRAVRTKRVVGQVVERLVKKGREAEDARKSVIALLEQVDLKTAKEGSDDKTEYLLFLPERKLDNLAELVDGNWDALVAFCQQATAQSATTDDQAPADPKAKGKKAKAKAKDTPDLPKEAITAAKDLLRDSRETPEIALFGRMIANSPDWNVEAACQVAQALSTHRVSMEFDFFTAVDDLKKDSESGSDMMGTVQFNSACFYRYAVIDCDALAENLGGNDQVELCKSSVEAFLKAFVHARPTGKQNSMAAHTLPSFLLLTVRDGGEPMSLANAFAKPVVVRKAEDDLQQLSEVSLLKHFDQLNRMYPGGLRAAYACAMGELDWPDSIDSSAKSVAEVIAKAVGLLDAPKRAA